MLLLPTLCRTKSFPATNVEGSMRVEPSRNAAASSAPRRRLRENVSSSESPFRSAGGSSRNMECGAGAAAPLTYLPVRAFFTGGSRNTPRVLSVCAGAFKRGAVASRQGAAFAAVFAFARRDASSEFSHSARSRSTFPSNAPRRASFRSFRVSNGFGNGSASPPRLSEARDLVRSSAPRGKTSWRSTSSGSARSAAPTTAARARPPGSAAGASSRARGSPRRRASRAT